MKKRRICLILALVLLISCCPAAQAAYTEMTFSDDVVEYVKKGESFSQYAINDGTGWYIGYGCAIKYGEYPNGITEEEADALLRSKMESSAEYINTFLLKKYDLTVTQGQFDAMIAMNYALGPSWMNKGNRLPTYITSGIGNYTDQQIASAFAAWCHVGGKVNTVALQRRIIEAKMFLYGDYTFERYGADLGWNWVILDANEGENAQSDVAVYKTGEIYAALPEAGRSGWYFAGWAKKDGSILLPTDIVSENLNLTAQWSATPVTAWLYASVPTQEETPAPEEIPVPEEVPAPEESPAPEEVPAPEESPAPEEVPAPEESPAPEEVPAPEESPAPEEIPVPEDIPVPEETPTPEEIPVPEETPAPEEVPAPEEPEEPETPLEPEAWSVFPDVPDSAWYAEYVAKLVGAGVVNGYDDGLFRPDNDVTWGEALKLILLSSGFRAQDPLETEEDEEPSHWASGYLAFAEKKGYLRKGGVEDLDTPITRDEMADLCAAALELTAETQPSPYADSSRASALKLFAAGIMEGSFDESGQRVFKGGDKLRRSEICAVLLRMQDYVARTWILFLGYRIPINYDLPFNTYDPNAFYTQNGRTYYDDGVTQVRYGIDVSWHQGAIDWAKVAADGIDFAIIRCGYRGSATGNLNEDEYFRDNIRGALENGIEVGVYFFSQALNVEEALEELDFTLKLIQGYNVTMPVVFDWEQYSGRSKTPDWNSVMECIVAFCDGVAAAGYTPMTYYNPSMAYLHLDLPRLQYYPKWLAHYMEVTNYYYDFQMWQYGSSGSVDGISGRVDMDILFTSFR